MPHERIFAGTAVPRYLHYHTSKFTTALAGVAGFEPAKVAFSFISVV